MSTKVTSHTKGALITSVSHRVPLINAVRAASKNVGAFCEIHGYDNNDECIGQYFVDHFWHSKPIEEMSRKEIRDYCLDNEIGVIIPTRDKELPFFAKESSFFLDHGIVVMVSPLDSILICGDKILYYQKMCEWGLPAIPTYPSFDQVQAERRIVRERYESLPSKDQLAVPTDESNIVCQKIVVPVYQPFIEGDEYSIDLYIDKDKNIVGQICRQTDYIGGREACISTTVDKPDITRLAIHLANKLNLWGQVVMKGIEQPDGEFLFSNCNPRMGGGTTLSIAAGLDVITYFFKECLDQNPSSPPFSPDPRSLRLICFPEDQVVSVE